MRIWLFLPYLAYNGTGTAVGAVNGSNTPAYRIVKDIEGILGRGKKSVGNVHGYKDTSDSAGAVVDIIAKGKMRFYRGIIEGTAGQPEAVYAVFILHLQIHIGQFLFFIDIGPVKQIIYQTDVGNVRIYHNARGYTFQHLFIIRGGKLTVGIHFENISKSIIILELHAQIGNACLNGCNMFFKFTDAACGIHICVGHVGFIDGTVGKNT